MYTGHGFSNDHSVKYPSKVSPERVHAHASRYTRSSQKVPGNVVQHCNGSTCDNAYLITFKVRPLRTHPLAPSNLPLLEAPAEDFFWNPTGVRIFRSSTVEFDLMSSMVAKRVPLWPIFRVGKSQKSLGARFGEYGGWVMTGMLFSARKCCTTSDVWLGALSLS
jgi:hypothetical protein